MFYFSNYLLVCEIAVANTINVQRFDSLFCNTRKMLAYTYIAKCGKISYVVYFCYYPLMGISLKDNNKKGSSKLSASI